MEGTFKLQDFFFFFPTDLYRYIIFPISFFSCNLLEQTLFLHDAFHAQWKVRVWSTISGIYMTFCGLLLSKLIINKYNAG